MVNFQFSKAAKILILSTAVVLLAAGCSKLANQQSVNQPISPSAHQPAQQALPAKNPGLDDSKLEKGQEPQQSTTTPAPVLNFQATATPVSNPPVQQPPQGPSVTQTVDGSSLNKAYDSIVAGETAIQLLKNGHTVKTEEFTGLGEMVLAIDGVAPGNKQFWEFYVNGQSSNVGASSYTLKAGDKIEWKLSTINSSGD